ncbi:MAG: ABC transporter ATP-binding protein [Actinomycetota bacterium]|nr:ABC transporter ATP-binding protein [Actinomycetota bacterium]
MARVTAPALEVEGLVKCYAGRAVVDGLSLVAPTGTVLALLGPNGAGKTTTVEICCGLRHADAGAVRVLGRTPRDPGLRERVALMPQEGGAYPGLRAREMLRLVAAYHRSPLDPDDLLSRLGLADSARTPVRRLSGGQRQRLSLALAVVGRPELAFLDEPTAGLDPHARRDTWDLIAALRRDGVTVVLTTHLMDEVEHLADEVVVIDRGRVVSRGTVAALTGGSVLTFAGPPGLPALGLAAVLPDGCSLTEPHPGRYVITAAGRAVDAAALAAVTAWCASHDVLAEHMRLAPRTLEDVYLELTAAAGRS